MNIQYIHVIGELVFLHCLLTLRFGHWSYDHHIRRPVSLESVLSWSLACDGPLSMNVCCWSSRWFFVCRQSMAAGHGLHNASYNSLQDLDRSRTIVQLSWWHCYWWHILPRMCHPRSSLLLLCIQVCKNQGVYQLLETVRFHRWLWWWQRWVELSSPTNKQKVCSSVDFHFPSVSFPRDFNDHSRNEIYVKPYLHDFRKQRTKSYVSFSIVKMDFVDFSMLSHHLTARIRIE